MTEDKPTQSNPRRIRRGLFQSAYFRASGISLPTRSPRDSSALKLKPSPSLVTKASILFPQPKHPASRSNKKSSLQDKRVKNTERV